MSNPYLSPFRQLAQLLSNAVFYASMLAFPIALYGELQPFIHQQMLTLDNALMTLAAQR